MNKEKINSILIGLGKIGCGYDLSENFVIDKPESSKKIISHARALSVHPKFNLIAGIDTNKDARDNFNSFYKKPIYSSLDKLISNIKDNIEMVIIAVNPKNQPKLVEEVIQKINPKVLLIEKPLATSMKEVRRIKKICDSKSDLIVCVNFHRRYLPVVQNWKKIISSGEIGKFIHGNIVYGKGLLTNGSHFINLAEYWIGDLENHKTLKTGLNYDDFDTETSFILESKKRRAILNINSIGGYQLRSGELDLWFEGGRICWLNNGNQLNFWPRKTTNNKLETYDSLSQKPEVYFTEITKSQYYVLDLIYKNLYVNKPYKIPCKLDDCIKTMELIFSAI